MLRIEELAVESFATGGPSAMGDDVPTADVKCMLITVPEIKNTYLGPTNCMLGCME